MRKITLTLIALLLFSITQAQQLDLESLNKKDLITLVDNKEKDIKKLKQEITSLDAKNKKNQESIELEKKDKEEIKGLLIETTNRWLKQVFVDKYITNEKYFLDSNIPEIGDDQEEVKKNFEQYDIILKSVKASNPSKDHERVVLKALDFNKNYLTLLRIRNEVLPQKFSEPLVESTLREIDSLPVLKGGKLQDTKVEIIGLLKNYKDRNCLLKKELDNFSKGDQDHAKPKYKGFENDARFKDYPYLIKTLQDIQKNVNLYTAETLPCQIQLNDPEGVETIGKEEAVKIENELPTPGKENQTPKHESEKKEISIEN